MYDIEKTSVCLFYDIRLCQPTRFFPLALANSKAMRAIRSVPWVVVTLKSMLNRRKHLRRGFPIYSPSYSPGKMSSRYPFSGMLIGLTLAKRSSSRRESYVGALRFRHIHRLVGSGRRTLQDLTLLDLIQYVIRQSFHFSRPIFQSKPLDGPHLDSALCHILCENLIRTFSPLS